MQNQTHVTVTRFVKGGWCTDTRTRTHPIVFCLIAARAALIADLQTGDINTKGGGVNAFSSDKGVSSA